MKSRTHRVLPSALLAVLLLAAAPVAAQDAGAAWRPVGSKKAKAPAAPPAESAPAADAPAPATPVAEPAAAPKAEAEAEAKARAESEAKARAEADEKAKADAKAAAEAEARAKEDEKARARAEARAKAEADAKAKAEEKARAEAEARAKEDEKARAKAEAKARAEADAKAKAEEKAKAEADARAAEAARLEKAAVAAEPSAPRPPPGAKKITPPVYTPVLLHLKDGGTYAGTLEYELKGYEYVITTKAGVERRFPFADVERVEKLPLPAAPVMVHLKDGGAYKGTLIRETPEGEVLIRTAKGTDRRFAAGDVERVERLDGAPAAAPQPPAAAPPLATPPAAAPTPAPAPAKKGAKGAATKPELRVKEKPPVAGPPPPPPAAPTPSPFAGAGTAWPSMGRAKEAKPLPKTSAMTAELVPVPPPPGFGSAPVVQAERVETVVKPRATPTGSYDVATGSQPPASPATPSGLTPAYEPPPPAFVETAPAAAEPPGPDKGEWSFDADKTGLAIGFDQKLESDKVRQSWAEKGGNLLAQEATVGVSFMSFETSGMTMTGTGFQGGARLSSLSMKAPDYESRETSWTAWKVGTGADFAFFKVDMGGGFSGSATMTQLSLVGAIGFLHAFGSFDSDTEWSGFAIGLDWAPTFVMTSTTSTFTVLGSTYTSTSSDSAFNAAGIALNFESGSMKTMAETMAKEARFKLSLFILPQTDKTPFLLSINAGWVWY